MATKTFFYSWVIKYILLPRTGKKTCTTRKIVYFLLAGHKIDFIAPCGANKSIFDPQVEKNRVQHGKIINFTRVVMLPLLCSVIKLHTPKINFFSLVAQYIIFIFIHIYLIMIFPCCTRFFFYLRVKNGFVCPAEGNKMHFMTC